MFRILKIIVLLLLVQTLSFGASAAEKKADSAEAAAEKYFAARDWKNLNALAESGRELPPRVQSLIANGFWYQRRWADSLAAMEKIEKKYPAGVAPFARLLMALALERTGQAEKAYAAGLELYQSTASEQFVRYYAMYLLERLTSSTDEKEKWLRRMVKSDTEPAQKAAVLNELERISRLSADDALELLRFEPHNSAALKAAEKAPDSPRKFYRLGYAAYLRGDNKTAVKWLSRLKFNGAYGESGTYYLGISLQRLNRSPEAEPLMKKLVYRRGGSYIQRAINRMRLMLGGKAGDAALADLKKMTASSNADIASGALYALARSGVKDAAEYGRLFLKRFPQSSRADTLRWTFGWKEYQDGNYDGALKEWSIIGDSSAQLLYWRGKALKALGKTAEAQKNTDMLLKKHALTVYAFLAVDGGSLEITDASLPDNMQPAPAGDLERWGFMTHAHMILEEKKDLPSAMRRVQLARWLGQEWEEYSDLRPTLEKLATGNKIPRKILEILYPRPFRAEVERSAKKYSVDPLFIWSIMKQESGFNPTVSSWVGAAGLMQLMPATAAGEAKKMGLKKYRLYSISDNIAMGASHLSGLFKRYDRADWAAAAYNAGSGNVNKWNAQRSGWAADAWMEAVPFRETRGYVKNVLRNYAVYQKLYGKTDMKSLNPSQENSEPASDPALEAPAVNSQEAAS
jgi:soluble lytic murein transglycosylase